MTTAHCNSSFRFCTLHSVAELTFFVSRDIDSQTIPLHFESKHFESKLDHGQCWGIAENLNQQNFLGYFFTFSAASVNSAFTILRTLVLTDNIRMANIVPNIWFALPRGTLVKLVTSPGMFSSDEEIRGLLVDGQVYHAFCNMFQSVSPYSVITNDHSALSCSPATVHQFLKCILLNVNRQSQTHISNSKKPDSSGQSCVLAPEPVGRSAGSSRCQR